MAAKKRKYLEYAKDNVGKKRGGQIRQYGDPDGKPLVRAPGKRKASVKKGKPDKDIPMPIDLDTGKKSRTRGRIGRRVGDSMRSIGKSVQKGIEIERRHRRAQQERIKARRNDKRLKKKGVKRIPKAASAFLRNAQGKVRAGK